MAVEEFEQSGFLMALRVETSPDRQSGIERPKGKKV